MKTDNILQTYRSAALMLSLADGCGCSGDDGDKEATPAHPRATGRYANLGCHTPVPFADLRNGEVVLDLGCGAGGDLCLAAKAVGTEGLAIGVDQLPEMAELARRNSESAGLKNVDVLVGVIERLPVDDASIDVVISNCVVNLSESKEGVCREIYRVLKPGGRIVIADTVKMRDLPSELADNDTLWSCCIGGALTQEEYESHLNRVGMTSVEFIAPVPDIPALAEPDMEGFATSDLRGYVSSVIVRATKPKH